MRFVPAFLVLAAALAPFTLPRHPPSDEPAEPLPPPGFHRLELALEEGGTLRYGLHVPKAEPGGEGLPLVLALHYGGRPTPYYGLGFMKLLVVPGLADLGAIIVAPDCPGRGWTDERSERAVLTLLDDLEARWPVDRDRTLVTGFSMGGIGAWFYARRHPDRFRAAIPVAGRPVGEPRGEVPVFAIHSSRDEIIELEPTRRAIDALKDRGIPAELVVVHGPTHYQTGRFARPLHRSIRWLEGVWGSSEGTTGPADTMPPTEERAP
jgi:predicted peptidase